MDVQGNREAAATTAPQPLLKLTQNPRLRAIEVKLHRAADHMRELEAGLQEFAKAIPTSVAGRRNAAGQIEYFIDSMSPVPGPTAMCLGDAIHNMRATLDHLAYQLVLLGGKVPSRSTQFPIARTAAKYPEVRDRCLAGAASKAAAIVDAVQPYADGNRAL